MYDHTGRMETLMDRFAQRPHAAARGAYYYEKDISACAVFGIMNEDGKRFNGTAAMTGIACMQERSNGLGGGFAAYGIYPEQADLYAFHLMYDSPAARTSTEEYLGDNFEIEKGEPIPTRDIDEIGYRPALWRYFAFPKDALHSRDPKLTEEDLIVQASMHINGGIEDALVCSSGKNMGIFKGVGFAEDIGRFYRLDEYEGYLWTAHGRFPTNTAGWWGGAHPFGLLDWSVVHNGEISSYGINKRYLENFDYHCTLFTDTEVITYLVDLLSRKHGLPFDLIADILAPPLWDEIERSPGDRQELFEAMRLTYGSAMVNGPFAVIAANASVMVGLNDRIKLRPLVAARSNGTLYISSEDSAIRAVCPDPEKVWMPKAGQPTIGRLR